MQSTGMKRFSWNRLNMATIVIGVLAISVLTAVALNAASESVQDSERDVRSDQQIELPSVDPLTQFDHLRFLESNLYLPNVTGDVERNTRPAPARTLDNSRFSQMNLDMLDDTTDNLPPAPDTVVGPHGGNTIY